MSSPNVAPVEPEITIVDAALIVVAPSDSIFKIPASMSTIEPALAFASRWKATPAVWAVTKVISLAAPAVVIFTAPLVSTSKATASKSKLPDPS